MEPERHPASSETDTLHSLAKLVAAYLSDGEGESLPSKQAVASSNLVSRSNLFHVVLVSLRSLGLQ